MPADNSISPSRLENLTALIDQKPEALALGDGELRVEALKATKYLYDLALKSEAQSRGRIVDLLSSISPSLAPQTRSQAAARPQDGQAQPHQETPALEATPVSELFVDGMDDEQIWSQLELRAENVCRALQYALDGMDERAEEDDESGIDGEDGEDDERMEEMREALERGEDIEDLQGMEVDTDEDSDEEEDEEESEDEPDVHLGEKVVELRYNSDEEDEDGEQEAEEEVWSEPRVDFSTFDTEMSVEYTEREQSSKPKYKPKPKKPGHPELDDGFFDLAAFNRETEEAEAKASSRGRLKRDSDDEDEILEDEVDMFAPIGDTADAFDEEEMQGGDGELFYKDFFDPPTGVPQKSATGKDKSKGKRKDVVASAPLSRVRFHEEVKVRMIKPKGKGLPTSAMYAPDDEEDDEDEEDEDYEYNEEEADDEDTSDVGSDESMEEANPENGESESDEDEEEEGSYDDESTAVEGEDGFLETMERFKDDLFADEKEPEQDLSTHEKRMATLQEEISALEAENVAKKDWTLMGEANSRSRPQNSLLEQDLEYERVQKSVPVITEEVVQSLEERIKARILESQFDDVVRRRPVDDKPFLPSRFFELQDTKSKQSLAEIYEDEYTAAQSGGVAGEDRDGKLKTEHGEIEKLWEQISGKLDALCNAHFTPKAPKALISTVSNVAAASMESALPTTMSTSSVLAPEEVFAPPTTTDLQARSELTPMQKRALRNKVKKVKKKARDAIEKSVDKFSQSRRPSNVKKQKEAALKSVVKSGKGVTVVGKQAKDLKTGKKTKS